MESKDQLNESERDMLGELKKHLKHDLYKDCVDAYLKEPTSEAITKTALDRLKKVIDEADRT
jgi:hypothetical protein